MDRRVERREDRSVERRLVRHDEREIDRGGEDINKNILGFKKT